MLYLVQPDRRLQWTANVGQEVLDLAAQSGKDLAQLDWWEDASSRADDDVVRVALRYGQACSAGIIVDGRHVVVVRHPSELRRTFAEAAANRAEIAPAIEEADRFIETQIPGWVQSGRDLDDRVEESLSQSVREADRDAMEELSRQAPKEELVAHWARLGGAMPDPA